MDSQGAMGGGLWMSTKWRWIAIVVVAWGVLVAVSAALSARTGIDTGTCLFRNLTGQPCATCGGTRATVHLARGEFAEALRMNPLVALAWLVVPIGGAWLVAHRRRGAPAIRPQVERTLWIGAGLLLALNWGYLLICQPV